MRLYIYITLIIIVIGFVVHLFMEYKIKNADIGMTSLDYGDLSVRSITQSMNTDAPPKAFDFDNWNYFQKRKFIKGFSPLMYTTQTIYTISCITDWGGPSTRFFQKLNKTQQIKIVTYVEKHPLSCSKWVDINKLYDEIEKAPKRVHNHFVDEEQVMHYVDKF